MWAIAKSLLVSGLLARMLCGVRAGFVSYVGNGLSLYQLDVVQDVLLEDGTTNYNSEEYLIIGEHPGWPLKRSLLQFEDFLNSTDCEVTKANMYVYFSYAHKASFYTVDQAPYVCHEADVHMVLEAWDEAQATSTQRLTGVNWNTAHLATDGTDAKSSITGWAPMYPGSPSGWKEFEVTQAVIEWASGQYQNNGLLLKVRDEGLTGRDLRYFSNAYSDSSQHAKIMVLCEDP